MGYCTLWYYCHILVVLYSIIIFRVISPLKNFKWFFSVYSECILRERIVESSFYVNDPYSWMNTPVYVQNVLEKSLVLWNVSCCYLGERIRQQKATLVYTLLITLYHTLGPPPSVLTSFHSNLFPLLRLRMWERNRKKWIGGDRQRVRQREKEMYIKNADLWMW